MASLLYWSVSAILLAIFFPELTTSCSCISAHPQNMYCTAKYVIMIKPKEMNHTADGFEIIYRARLSRVFKDTEGYFKAKSNILIRTSSSEASCGVVLNMDEKYIIAGNNIEAGLPRIGLCDLNLSWKSLYRKQKKGFQKLYQDGCECKIESRYMSVIKGPSVCTLSEYDYLFNCEEQHSVCMKHQNNKCEWLQSRDFKGCLRKKEKKKAEARKKRLEAQAAAKKKRLMEP